MLGANVPTKELHRELKKKGWQLTRTAGDHDVFTHPEAKHHLSIPRHRQLKAPLVMKVLKAMKVNETKVLSFLQFCIAEQEYDPATKKVKPEDPRFKQFKDAFELRQRREKAYGTKPVVDPDEVEKILLPGDTMKDYRRHMYPHGLRTQQEFEDEEREKEKPSPKNGRPPVQFDPDKHKEWNVGSTKSKRVQEDADKYMDNKPATVTADQATDYKKRADRAFKPKYYEPDNEPPPKRKDWDYDDEDVKPIVKKYLEKMIDKKPATSPTPSESYDIGEAEYQGRDVPLNKPMAGDVKKSKVFVRNAEGNVVKVNFGDKNMTIKKNIPARRKSFRARHNCDEPGPKTKARYWSCKAW